MRQTFQGKEFLFVKGNVGEVPRHALLAADGSRRSLAAGFAEDHATAAAEPGGLLLVQHHQATALALGSEPEALAPGVDGDAFEQGVEVQQHAAGASLADQVVR
ncbi:hypothetical protein D3C85_1052790 [compost metagenome]